MRPTWWRAVNEVEGDVTMDVAMVGRCMAGRQEED